MPKLKGEQLADLWKDLAGGDAPRAHRALWTLAAAPQESVKYLDTRLKPADATTEDKIRALIRDLDNTEFKTREKATAELTRIAHRAEKQVRAALAGGPSAEARKRLKAVLSVIEGTRPAHASDTLRAIRAIHVLELIGTPEACAVLEKLVKGTPSAYETRHAKAALARLARQVEDEP